MDGKKTEYKVEWNGLCTYLLTRVDNAEKRMTILITNVDANGYDCYVSYGNDYSRNERLNRVK
jgi:hypothetical protein